ncbi:MAG: sugar phosphate isomerase/epimerase, partial [Clostridia bacterium]|nr:sugar phosphate isomerase/epimerase [Clostridia bacterium]
YPEYTEDFALLLKARKGDMNVHSMHVYTMHYEPELFSQNERSYSVAEGTFRDVLNVGKILGAQFYTMHGRARLKRSAFYDDYEKTGVRLEKLCSVTKEYGIKLCLENVEWALYNRAGYFTEVKKYAPDLYATFDVKQARISGDHYGKYLGEMGANVKTVHLSDVNESGKICLPGKGTFDFEDLFRRLKDVGFDGDMLIEVYSGDYGETQELKQSLEYLEEIKYKIF